MRIRREKLFFGIWRLHLVQLLGVRDSEGLLQLPELSFDVLYADAPRFGNLQHLFVQADGAFVDDGGICVGVGDQSFP